MDAPSTPTSADRVAVAAVLVASMAVLVMALATSFRQPFGSGVAPNAARMALLVAAGGGLALAGACRRVRAAEEPASFELSIYAGSCFAAAGAALGAGVTPALPLAGGAPGAVLLGAAAWALTRAADRPTRLANLFAGGMLASSIAAGALASSFGATGTGAVPSLVAWLLGDVSMATGASAAVACVGMTTLVVAAFRLAGRDEPGSAQLAVLGPLVIGFAFGLAGVIAFIGSFVPRSVRALAPGASAPAFVAASVVAGGASVAAIDAVPRWLIGGYALPLSVALGMLAVPIYLGWNRRRLRRGVGSAPLALEALEVVLIAAGTLVAFALAVFLTQTVRAAT